MRGTARRLFLWLAAKRGSAIRLSNLADRVAASGAASAGLDVTAALLRRRWSRPAGRGCLLLVRWALCAAIGVHLAADSAGRALSSARVLNLLFRRRVRAFVPDVATPWLLGLLGAGELRRLVADLPPDDAVDDERLNRMAGLALLRTGQPAAARRRFERLASLDPDSALAHRLVGRSFVAEGSYPAAAPHFERSVAIDPSMVMAHHNSAARYDIPAYRPQPWELEAAGSLLVYDTLAQQSEELAYIGDFDASAAFGKRLLDYQATIARGRDLPLDLRQALARLDPSYDPGLPTCLLPYEWVTQLGHLGMIEAHLKMRRSGMLAPANDVLLAPRGKVANHCFLQYFREFLCIVEDQEQVAALFPYQRLFGNNFMFVRTADAGIEPWSAAAARAQVAFARAGRPPILRLHADDDAFGRDMLARQGIPSGARLVGLHVREGGFYGEGPGAIGDHRNADIRDYREAIEACLDRGYWVVRLGDRSMRRLPRRDRVIDYGLSEWKSARMDVFLLAACSMIIGTTSGLTTAAQCFGTPMVLVNCISPDWQFWGESVDFTVKRIYDRCAKRFLGLAEMFAPPVQGLLVNSLQLARGGLAVQSNSAEDIAAAVSGKLDQLEGAVPYAGQDEGVSAAYRAAMRRNPLMFGAARPAPSFLAAHPQLLGTPAGATP